MEGEHEHVLEELGSDYTDLDVDMDYSNDEESSVVGEDDFEGTLFLCHNDKLVYCEISADLIKEKIEDGELDRNGGMYFYFQVKSGNKRLID